MKSILLLLVPFLCLAQSATQTEFETFKSDLDAYATQTNLPTKPLHCNEYVLKYTVNGNKISMPLPTTLRNLCDDLKAYDKNKSLENWTFEIKPIGNKYYIITAERAKPSVIKLVYYYDNKIVE